jgi:hypothetical protein
MTISCKEELEFREAAASKRTRVFTDAEKEKLEIERIREEGMQALLAKQQQRRQEQSVSLNQAYSMKTYHQMINSASTNDCTLKLKWDKAKSFDQANLKTIFGTDAANVIYKAGKRSALVVFKDVVGAFKAMNNAEIKKLVKMDWLDGKEPEAVPHIREMNDKRPPVYKPSTVKASTLGKGQRYEDITLQKMRDLERDRLIKELLQKERE